jgi:hypothetical protein
VAPPPAWRVLIFVRFIPARAAAPIVLAVAAILGIGLATARPALAAQCLFEAYANNDSASMLEDGGTLTIDVLANDRCWNADNGFTGFANLFQPSHGTSAIAASGAALTYTPAANFFGTDTFTYRFNNTTYGTSNLATVTVTVSAVNDAPTQYFDGGWAPNEDAHALYMYNEYATGHWLDGGSTDEPSQHLTLVKVVASAGLKVGAAELTAFADHPGTYSFSPLVSLVPDFNGTAWVDVTVRDDGGTANGGVDTATFRTWFTVTPVPDPTVARNDTYSTKADTPLTVAAPGVLANDADPDGPIFALPGVPPAHGHLSLLQSGAFTYTPDAGFQGTDSFTYSAVQARPDQTIESYAVATVRIKVAQSVPLTTTPKPAPSTPSTSSLPPGSSSEVASASVPSLHGPSDSLTAPSIGSTGPDRSGPAAESPDVAPIVLAILLVGLLIALAIVIAVSLVARRR